MKGAWAMMMTKTVEKLTNAKELSVNHCEYMIRAERGKEGIVRFYLNNDFEEYQDYVMQMDQGVHYYSDGYIFDVPYDENDTLLLGELYYIGENEMVSVRLMSEDEIETMQEVYDDFLKEQ